MVAPVSSGFGGRGRRAFYRVRHLREELARILCEGSIGRSEKVPLKVRLRAPEIEELVGEHDGTVVPGLRQSRVERDRLIEAIARLADQLIRGIARNRLRGDVQDA